MREKYYIRLFLIILGTTMGSMALNQLGMDKETILMIFMVGVLLVTAYTKGYRFGIIASLTSVAVFNYFFAEPLHTFAISDSNDIALMFFFLVASVISSSLTARFQRQLLISQKNERTAKLLYQVTQRLLNVTGEGNIIHQGLCCIKEFTGFQSIVELDESEQVYYSDDFTQSDAEKSMELYITGLAKKLGMLKVFYKADDMDIEQKWLVNTVAAQMGIALDREFAYNERENIRIAMEREHLKSSMLRSISHDLRTPLTGIAGASSYILQRRQSLEREDVENLVRDINEQAVWLTMLVENMLQMIRIDNGKLEVKKQIEVVDDLINEAVAHVIGLSERSFSIVMPKELITLSVDGKMIVQVLINLLSNAVNHTSKNCPIELAVSQVPGYVEFCISDGGAGIDPIIKDDIFSAFVTSGKVGADGKKGVGLGLAICKAFVQAHDGTISICKSHLGGASLTFRLPAAEVE